MTAWAFGITASLYALACAGYFAYLFRGVARDVQLSRGALLAALAGHTWFLVADFVTSSSRPTFDIHQSLSLAAFLVALGYATTPIHRRAPALGAFVTPIALLLFVGSGVSRRIAPVSDEVRSAVLPLHVTVNILGIVAFALAFGASVAYLIQERLLRRKQLGGLFRRLPPLETLDKLSFRLVATGFPMFTIGVVTGALWAVRLAPDQPALRASQAFGIVAWVLFAAVLLLRVVAGWRGRRAAIGTVLGFVSAAAVLVGYVLRGPGGEP